MTLWTNQTAAQATGGEAQGQWQAQRVEIDTRKLEPGDLFVAIQGERFDGHAFVPDALAKGAAAAVISSHSPHPTLSQGERAMSAFSLWEKGGVSRDEGCFLRVPNTLKALEDLGKAGRARCSGRVVGVTGSVGKTSTKEMLRLGLSAHGKTYATTGNYNNHIGTPLNLANLPPDAAFAVMEMGMNHAGEISHLTRMVRPHLAIITAVEAVHLEFFDSVAGIADAKAEIFDGLEPGGVAVLPADNPYFERLKAKAGGRASSIISFGEAPGADCRLMQYQPVAGGAMIEAELSGARYAYRLSAIGRHWAITSLIVLATAKALGLDVGKTAQALERFEEVDGRGRMQRVACKGGQFYLLDDSYNASPASMRSAFARTQECWQAQGARGRKIAVLGDMLELGPTAPELHAALAGELVRCGFDKVYCSGALMRHLFDALPPALRGHHAASAKELLPQLLGALQPDDMLLVKGSHGSKIYELAGAIMGAGEQHNAV